MKTTPSIQAEIARLSERRQAIWRGETESAPQEIMRIEARLRDLYEELRAARAGNPDNAAIKRTARAEQARDRASEKVE